VCVVSLWDQDDLRKSQRESILPRIDMKAPLTKLKFKKQPMCELLHDRPAEHFTFRRDKWLFVSTQADEDFNEYHFEIVEFFSSPASTVDWLAHLSEKGWFDAADFCAMIHRFREATDSFGGL
jgi:hypothetical protein